MGLAISTVTADGCLQGTRIVAEMSAVAAELSRKDVHAVEVDWQTQYLGGPTVPHRMLVFADGTSSSFTQAPATPASFGNDVAYLDGGCLRYGRVENISQDSLIVLPDGDADPVTLPQPHPALPDMIIASVRFDDNDWVGIDLTDEILALDLGQVAALRDTGLHERLMRNSLPPALAARLFGVSQIEIVAAISMFFGRLPSAGSDGPQLAREITAEDFEVRRQLHYGLMRAAPSPGM